MSEIFTAEEAVKKADAFVGKYYMFNRLESVKKINENWVVKYDVSVIGPKEFVIVKLDAKSGEVIEYTTND